MFPGGVLMVAVITQHPVLCPYSTWTAPGRLGIGKQPSERTTMEINTGISDTARKEIAEGLSRLLADTYTLYLKTHGYHWNVTGPMFRSLHLMFEEEYLELRDAVDEIAERVRALDHKAPGSYKEDSGDPEALEMVRRLVAGHETVIRTAREVVEIAEAADDVATADMATGRIEVHEKTAWMLRATAS
jgi:starvation-inducible DNA-binding protein